ncbi:Uncharacterized protein T310_9955 [Rasamsonia emersonii CBS 393.64]|uniref:Uncharacterized protein n=1 Tax=Rasamsonia emersonii (strain ATCC 16479 / CBS 393.64 / IMI 116815) TaxID=1408163 RepID=A0A0F4YE37_RASE3|nr:Uncharacterized protein T310_9955 [Rasamsonia emersonii CBS 393.64]KKA16452.1 Uncharacterized protein T310_9955 [Rasamsonia emersonii CBS 393.64]
MDLLSALKTLRNAPDDALRIYRHEIASVLIEVEKRLRRVVSATDSQSKVLPMICCFCQQSSSSTTHEDEPASGSSEYSIRQSDDNDPDNNPDDDPDNDAGIGSSDGAQTRISINLQSCPSQHRNIPDNALSDASTPAPERPYKLVEALTKVLPWLWEFKENEPVSIIRRKRLRLHKRDRRLDDIQRVEGNRSPKEEDKLFRGLAQRSLALQFTRTQETEQKTEQLSKVDKLCQILSSRKFDRKALYEKRGGVVQKYIRRMNPNIASDDIALTIRAINAGIKQLVIERLLKERLMAMRRSNSTSGVSAVTALTIRAFRELHLEEIPNFIDVLFLESSVVELPVKPSTSDQSSTTPLHSSGHHSCFITMVRQGSAQQPVPKRVCLAPLRLNDRALDILIQSPHQAPEGGGRDIQRLPHQATAFVGNNDTLESRGTAASPDDPVRINEPSPFDDDHDESRVDSGQQLETSPHSQHRPADNCGVTLPGDDSDIVQGHNATLHPEEQEAARTLSHIHDLTFNSTETALDRNPTREAVAIERSRRLPTHYSGASFSDSSYTSPQVCHSIQNQAEQTDGSASVPYQTTISPGQQEGNQLPSMSSTSQASDSPWHDFPYQAEHRHYNTYQSTSDNVNSTESCKNTVPESQVDSGQQLEDARHSLQQENYDRPVASMVDPQSACNSQMLNLQPFPNSDPGWLFPNSDPGWVDSDLHFPFPNWDTTFFYS